MTYDRQILQVLAEAGAKGISIKALVKHVYNLNVSLFFTPDLDEISAYVRRYVQRNSKRRQALIEGAGRRGCYRLNARQNAAARQLLLDFQQKEQADGQAEGKEEKPAVDLSLDLFA